MTDFILQPEGGLANRTHLMLQFLTYCRLKEKNLVVVWGKQNSTNAHVSGGHFLDIFKEISEINFTEDKLKTTKRPKDLKEVLKINRKQYLDSYKTLQPSVKIEKTIKKIRPTNSIYNSCHIRRTDLLKSLEKRSIKIDPDEIFEKFIKTENQNTYIATDNPATQKVFLKKFGKLIFFYEAIQDKKINNFRYTNLHCTGVDLFMCCYSKKFIGTKQSTLSLLIERIRNTLPYENSGLCINSK